MSRFLLAVSAPAVVAVALAACAGDGANDAVTPGDTIDASSPGERGVLVEAGADVGAGDASDAAPVPCGKIGEACCAEFACNTGLACDGAKCAAAVAPYTCAAGAPEAVFVSESAPPATVAPWSRPYASVVFANCGTTTWTIAAPSAPAGVKLGPAAPRDQETWTPGRIALPADVPPSSQVTIVVPMHVRPLTGPHAYAYELVREGVAWLGQPSPTHSIDVEAPAAAKVPLCAGMLADPTGGDDARAAMQACLDATPSGGTLALPPGIFRLSGVVSITKPMTVTTAGATKSPASCLAYDAPSCAVLRADANTLPSAAGARGFVRMGLGNAAVSAVTLDHVVVDGNRGARLASPAAAACASGNNGEGINIGANCTTCTVTASASVRALCGSALEWDGDGVTVKNTMFAANGDHATQNMWSDGLTVHKSDNAVVDSCRFIDNSDVGFISGGGTNAKYTGNVAMQLEQATFAALMLDNFNNGALGNFTGTVMSGNTVICAAPCHFGIELGPHPWYASPNIVGGTVTGNVVRGAYVGINAQGAGTAAAPTVISANDLGPTPSSAAFQCGNVSGLSPLNVSAESIVDLKGGAATGSISVPCP
ncbi:MAG: hypothetical protein JWP87_351 [Labilithrix sp.]|nr:hypothetical protein [Labilithrix sp.]